MDDEEEKKKQLQIQIKTTLEEVKKNLRPDDGWKVLVEAGDSLGGLWPVGVTTASFKEFAEKFQVKPWVFGPSLSAVERHKLLVQFGVRDPQNREWVFSSELRMKQLDESIDEQVTWKIESTADVIEVGQWLADTFGRPLVVRAFLDDGSLHRVTSTFYNKQSG